MHPTPRLLSAIALIVGASLATPASAQSTWTYASFTEGATNAAGFGNNYSTAIGTTTLTVKAYSSTGAGGVFAAANLANYGAGSGFGVRNQTEGTTVIAPNHAMDNYAATDLLALQFTNATTPSAANVVITSLTTGWHNTSTAANASCGGAACGTDSDISLLRWTGAAAPTILGGSIATLLSGGWALVNNYADMADGTARTTGANTANGSSWWLISAYNSSWGTGSNTANLSNGDDFVKVLASVSTVAASTRVPEPASLGLVAIAALGGLAARRKVAKADRRA